MLRGLKRVAVSENTPIYPVMIKGGAEFKCGNGRQASHFSMLKVPLRPFRAFLWTSRPSTPTQSHKSTPAQRPPHTNLRSQHGGYQ